MTVDKQPPKPEDLAWAKEKLKDVVFSSVLNIKLFQTGICAKLTCEMNAQELARYNELIQSMHIVK